MDTVTRSSAPDTVSRGLSVLSLLVALAVGAYVYYQHRSPSTELVGAFDSELAEHASRYTSARQDMAEQFQAALDRQDKRMEEWNSQLVNAIEDFRQDGETLLNRLEDDAQLASQQRQEAFRTELARRATPSVPDDERGPNTLAGPSNQAAAGNTSGTTPQDDDLAGAESSGDRTTSSDVPATDVAAAASGARLKLVNTALRLGSADPTLLVIENEGDREAVIERVRFRPVSDFEVPPPSTEESAAPSGTTTIVYEATDNTSQRAGYHGIYDRRLAEAVRLAPGESVTLRIMIRDPRWEGFGFEGRLALDYNKSESLMVNAARVTFRSNEG